MECIGDRDPAIPPPIVRVGALDIPVLLMHNQAPYGGSYAFEHAAVFLRLGRSNQGPRIALQTSSMSLDDGCAMLHLVGVGKLPEELPVVPLELFDGKGEFGAYAQTSDGGALVIVHRFPKSPFYLGGFEILADWNGSDLSLQVNGSDFPIEEVVEDFAGAGC